MDEWNSAEPESTCGTQFSSLAVVNYKCDKWLSIRKMWFDWAIDFRSFFLFLFSISSRWKRERERERRRWRRWRRRKRGRRRNGGRGGRGAVGEEGEELAIGWLFKQHVLWSCDWIQITQLHLCNGRDIDYCLAPPRRIFPLGPEEAEHGWEGEAQPMTKAGERHTLQLETPTTKQSCD